MSANNKTVCVIPARLGSTRLPKKMLADLGGKPLLQRTYEASQAVTRFDQVVVACDAQELYDLVIGFGGEAILTSPGCATGTDRLVELQSRGAVSADIWVNWQGDEPFISEAAISDLLQSSDASGEKIWTLKKKINEPADISSPHVVKVVTDHAGRALYFSRSPIPFVREEGASLYRHVGLYAYSDAALKKIGRLKRSSLEIAESLEQLRFLEGGIPIQVHETSQEIFGIDTKEQLLAAQNVDLMLS